MARFSKLNAWLEKNEDKVVVVAYDDLRAVAHRAKVAANNKRRADAQAKRDKVAVDQAAVFAIGQMVFNTHRPSVRGEIVRINESAVITIKLQSGAEKSFLASALAAI